jgi:hypothetical protein
LVRKPEEKRPPGKLKSRLKGGVKDCEAKIRLQAVVNKVVKLSNFINGVKFLDELRDC